MKSNIVYGVEKVLYFVVFELALEEMNKFLFHHYHKL